MIFFIYIFIGYLVNDVFFDNYLISALNDFITIDPIYETESKDPNIIIRKALPLIMICLVTYLFYGYVVYNSFMILFFFIALYFGIEDEFFSDMD